ncbi:PD-(D/E)XK nuclease family transposase [Tumebacillus sp. ITR2]|uniref:PD-(D/E)XK nuclease family transposase n=1 Tax=Tumebacillus amylolyticus TaxID=2801339 RepID=A0ABS1J4V3_9BACL|nr:Rpn family recombination-promoting nuclease/putative transposase [Tumebacillus amylolyticus]MBL0385307.1 PD-(D/E)XK nuclease family transposase [Tumebacillus amylolyticus]
MEQLMDLKVDFAFKQIFGKVGNEAILIAFLNGVLNPPADNRIKFVEILNPEMNREHLEDKASALDIRARTEQNVHVNIEIQLANKYDMEKRTLYYWSCLYNDQMSKGMPYTQLDKTITINILNYRFLKETDRFHTTFHLYEDRQKFLLTDIMEVHFLELPKLMAKWDQQEVNPHEEDVVRWLLLLEADDRTDIRKELEEIAMEDPVMKQAFEKWEELSRDPKKLVEYRMRQKAILDAHALEKEAEIRGSKRKQTEIAERLLKMGMALEQIVEATGLSLKEVKTIEELMH